MKNWRIINLEKYKNDVKENVDFEWLGERNKGKEVTDIVMRAKGEVTIGKSKFHAGEVIAIIEVKSTTDTVSESNFLDRFKDAKDSLKNHINLDEYKKAQFGVAIAFAYDPVDMLSDGTYPSEVGSYNNPYAEVFTKTEIEKLGGGG